MGKNLKRIQSWRRGRPRRPKKYQTIAWRRTKPYASASGAGCGPRCIGNAPRKIDGVEMGGAAACGRGHWGLRRSSLWGHDPPEGCAQLGVYERRGRMRTWPPYGATILVRGVPTSGFMRGGDACGRRHWGLRFGGARHGATIGTGPLPLRPSSACPLPPRPSTARPSSTEALFRRRQNPRRGARASRRGGTRRGRSGPRRNWALAEPGLGGTGLRQNRTATEPGLDGTGPRRDRASAEPSGRAVQVPPRRFRPHVR